MMGKSSRVEAIVAAVVGVVVVIVFAYVVTRGGPKSSKYGEGFNGWLGRVAPPLSLPNLAGETVNLDDLKGKTVVLDFWATWCPSCVQEMPKVDAIAGKYTDGTVAYFPINVGEPPSAAAAYIKRTGLAKSTLLDAGMKASEAYDAQYIPLLVVIDPAGRIVAYEQGVVPDLETALPKWIETARQSGQAK
ncbi:MAG: TlpA disulfide reductase family protein [Tepidisphaeraceae bacterium]